MIRKKEKEFIIKIMEILMMENGIMIYLINKEYFIFKMEINMKVKFQIINQKDMEFTLIQIKLSIMEIGRII